MEKEYFYYMDIEGEENVLKLNKEEYEFARKCIAEGLRFIEYPNRIIAVRKVNQVVQKVLRY